MIEEEERLHQHEGTGMHGVMSAWHCMSVRQPQPDRATGVYAAYNRSTEPNLLQT